MSLGNRNIISLLGLALSSLIAYLIPSTDNSINTKQIKRTIRKTTVITDTIHAPTSTNQSGASKYNRPAPHGVRVIDVKPGNIEDRVDYLESEERTEELIDDPNFIRKNGQIKVNKVQRQLIKEGHKKEITRELKRKLIKERREKKAEKRKQKKRNREAKRNRKKQRQ